MKRTPMTIKEYYTAPKQEIFNDIKRNALFLWKTYDDSNGYATEKINDIKDLENVSDNAWFIVAMFDPINQSKLLSMVEPATAIEIRRARHY